MRQRESGTRHLERVAVKGLRGGCGAGLGRQWVAAEAEPGHGGAAGAGQRLVRGPLPEPQRSRVGACRALPLYSMRHATASIRLAAGAPVAVAAKMMGHSVDMFCETYADLLVEATEDAAARAGALLEAHTPKETPQEAEPVPIHRGCRRKAAG